MTQTLNQRVGQAQNHGGARKAFIARVESIDTDVINGLGATAAWAEVRAALREMHRRIGR